ncbi:MAG TPA: DUF72 domain-containing protein [Armatimonadota bacterium]|nr:DUF72 domain-containing protein [Armatimonadota bacterium]
MNTLIGTSGFSYDDWKGHFYPPDIKRADMLTYYARRFPAVELNTTYYGIPAPETLWQMSRRVPPGFRFAVKAHQDMTHSGVLMPEVFQQFREAVAPLADQGMLGCVLAQFPWSFKRTPENERFLAVLRQELPDMPVVVEFRNAAWVDEAVFDRLRELDLGYCCVDEPRLKGLVPPVAATTSGIGYVRFHGRNYQKWWQHDQPHERYNYLYSAEELQEWVPKIEQLAAGTETTYVFFNNHYEGKAGVNAQQLAELLNVPLPNPEATEAQPQLDIGETRRFLEEKLRAH